MKRSLSETQWREAIEKNLDTFHEKLGNVTIKSIFFGGGTPSLMQPQTVAHLLQRIFLTWPTSETAEITLEANPYSIESCSFEGFKAAGINRISIGIQSFDDASLKFLGRLHSGAQAEKTLLQAQRVFDNVSFDLIYARPEQTCDSWKNELAHAASFGTPHLSVYQLTIERGTAFYQDYQRQKFSLPTEDVAFEMFAETQSYLKSKGLPAYEVSNHARAGFASQHNLAYWRYENYLGLGPGAHSRLFLNEKKMGLSQFRSPKTWYETTQTQGHGTEKEKTITPEDAATEALMMGLRLTEGVSFEKVKHVIDEKKLPQLAPFVRKVFQNDTPYLQATPQGFPVLNHIIKTLLI